MVLIAFSYDLNKLSYDLNKISYDLNKILIGISHNVQKKSLECSCVLRARRFSDA